MAKGLGVMTMDNKKWEHIISQLPQRAKILRKYRAMEGDTRLIISLPDDEVAERRYTIQGEDSDCPTVKLMP
jgi:hypothetical protein